jgi:hypothetical protein
VVGYLASKKSKALSSNPSTKGKRKEIEREKNVHVDWIFCLMLAHLNSDFYSSKPVCVWWGSLVNHCIYTLTFLEWFSSDSCPNILLQLLQLPSAHSQLAVVVRLYHFLGLALKFSLNDLFFILNDLSITCFILFQQLTEHRVHY